jgi:UDP-sulfoquinovose synthase
MGVLILGRDGYWGWTTKMLLSRWGYEVAVKDNYFRRRACTELNREPLPLNSLQKDWPGS